MMRSYIVTILLLVAGACCMGAAAQDSGRRITPVKPSTNTVLSPKKGTSEEVIQQYLTGDTASAAATEQRDSLKKVYPHYPMLTDLTLGVNILDPVLALFGQKYGGVDVNATLNMWNRLQPVVDLGVGWAKYSPDDKSFTYRGKLSPYARVGVNYNFVYKSDPAYKVFLGVKCGYSFFNYEITDVAYNNGYWGENGKFDISGQKSHAVWGEFLVGLNVKLWRNISAGWQAKYHRLFNHKSNANSEPWYIPGFGPRNSNLAVTFNVCYTLPLCKDKWPKKPEPAVKGKGKKAAATTGSGTVTPQ